MKNIRLFKGFTLIEMIITIVIISIISITAVPYYIDITRDARISTLKGAQGAITSADDFIYSKSVLVSTHKLESSEIKINNKTKVKTIYGHFINNANTLHKVAKFNGYSIFDIKTNTLDNDETMITRITLTQENNSEHVEPDLETACYLEIYQDNSDGTLKFELIKDEC